MQTERGKHRSITSVEAIIISPPGMKPWISSKRRGLSYPYIAEIENGSKVPHP